LALTHWFIDEATVIWERSIVDAFTDAPPELRLPPPDFKHRFESVSKKVSVVHSRLQRFTGAEFSNQLSEALMGSVGEWDAFKICQ
jgi:hypothetical protein